MWKQTPTSSKSPLRPQNALMNHPDHRTERNRLTCKSILKYHKFVPLSVVISRVVQLNNRKGFLPCKWMANRLVRQKLTAEVTPRWMFWSTSTQNPGSCSADPLRRAIGGSGARGNRTGTKINVNSNADWTSSVGTQISWTLPHAYPII